VIIRKKRGLAGSKMAPVGSNRKERIEAWLMQYSGVIAAEIDRFSMTREDREDACQMAQIRAYKAIFENGGEEMPPAAYLRRIAHNVAVSMYRQRSRDAMGHLSQEGLESYDNLCSDGMITADFALCFETAITEVRRLVSTIDDPRVRFALFHRKYSQDRLASLLGVSRSWLQRRINDAFQGSVLAEAADF